MKLGQNICNTTGQCESVITFDLAFYARPKQSQMKYPEEFNNTVTMGGFHIALNYLSLFGKKYANSGLEDLMIETGVYAAATSPVLMLGKSYNRGIRAHKLFTEAMFILDFCGKTSWKKLVRWTTRSSKTLFAEVVSVRAESKWKVL